MLNIFVNTWGNYNENGADGGEWITLPTEPEELKTALATIAKNMGDRDPEFCIHDYEWISEIEIREIGENENITALNTELEKLGELDEWEQEVFCAAVEIWGYTSVDPDEIDNYRLCSDVKTEYDLGYYWIQECGCACLKEMGHLANYFDYKALGRDISMESDGGFSTYGWVEKA